MKPLISGDSVTISLIFPGTYEIANLVNIIVGLDGKEIARKSANTVFATDDPRIFLVKVASSVTQKLTKGIPLQIALIDSVLGVKHTTQTSLYFTEASFNVGENNVNTLTDVSVIITISEAGISINVTLATIARGYSALELFQIEKELPNATFDDMMTYYAGRKSVAVNAQGDGATITHNLGSYVTTKFVRSDGEIIPGIRGEKIPDNLNAVTLRTPLLDDLLNQTYTGFLICEKY